MTTLTVTLANPKKAGNLLYFTVQFNLLDFDQVTDSIAEIKTIDELMNSKLWTVL